MPICIFELSNNYKLNNAEYLEGYTLKRLNNKEKVYIKLNYSSKLNKFAWYKLPEKNGAQQYPQVIFQILILIPFQNFESTLKD